MALGRTRIGRRQRAESSADQQQSAESDSELESYLAALAPEDDVETTGSGRSFGSSQVYQLRLPLMAEERLKELAAQQGTSPSALARDWVMQHLADHASQEPVHEWPPAEERPPAHAQPQPEGNTPHQQYSGDLFGGEAGYTPVQDDYVSTGEAYPNPYSDGPNPYSDGPNPYSDGVNPYGAEPTGANPQGADPYGLAETDTEITIPGGQYRYY